MKTIALRFGDHFAPECGTIEAHQKMISELGYVWYGKMGTPLSVKIINELNRANDKKILLIHSGKFGRYWAYFTDVTRERPLTEEIPLYYRNMTDKFKTWFKIIRIEDAPKDIMSKCRVISSGSFLNEASKHSMSPYFIIDYDNRE